MEDRTLKVKLCDKKAKLPAYAHPGDAGLDLFSPEKIILRAGKRIIVDTKVAMELPEGTVGLIWDKSGLGVVKGIKVMGGVFDYSFRGTYTIGLINLSNEDLFINEGDKICQLLIQPIIRVNVEQVEKIDESTSRGTSRLGSTGR
jgi:dUTP pyrophosphatase